MDRGMVKIEGKNLLDFVNSFYENLFDKQIDVSDLLRTLFRLEMTWYTGKAFFNDTLLTCILMHRDPSIITTCTGNKLAALAIEATMTAASLVSYLMTSSPVIKEEDFHANLYGMNWWTSTYAGGHLPRSNTASLDNSNSNLLTKTPGEIRLNLLLEQLEITCRQNSSSSDRFYFARLYHWIKFLNEFIKITSVSPSTGSIYDLISQLQSAIGHLEDENDNEIISSTANTKIVFPELANLFGLGCVRPKRTILSLTVSIRTWNSSLKNDLEDFTGEILTKRPKYIELIRKLSERSRDAIKPTILPIFRTILYFSIVQNRFQTFYQFEARDQFISSSLPAAISLTKIPDLALLLQDFVQVYCSNPSRQRRHLPDLISFWDERILNVANVKELAGYRTICWFDHFRDLLAFDLILLFGHLKLLSNPSEEIEAAQMICMFFEKFKSQGGKEEIVPMEIEILLKQQNLKLARNEIRWKHRWSIISKRFSYDSAEISISLESILSWFKTMLKLGSTAFSLPEPNWFDIEGTNERVFIGEELFTLMSDSNL